MKKMFLICIGLLAISASTAAAQIQVAWNDCKIDGGSDTRTSTCLSNSGVNRLAISYTANQTIADFVAIDGQLDIQLDNGNPNQWWEFKNAGACRQNNASIGIDVSVLPNSFTCEDTWDSGASATGLFTGYAIGFGAPNRNRAVFAIARPASNPTVINSGSNYFAWIFQITNGNTLSCTGCADPAAIFSTQMTVSGLSGASAMVLSGSPDDGESCVSWNGGSCLATPAQSTTWGKVKAMYR